MALPPLGPIRRELLYTMNGERIYRDEISPIGQPPSVPWKLFLYYVFLVGTVIFAFWSGFRAQ